ncbi:MAG: hypothetical protein P0Y48_06520 [Candidatus Microbacterium phytovorans]|uniref:Uncharacterized protein n=1 Tax=Candidatus Microbacterium phytovorans TaxID=3121374 RepID=A0AAJ6B450_9MICO|nr:hypothetical protein [Microbacterium sp.]WEK14840.1 MAG: hypothetical protein P0Y48_06520 [Microbacterium sp.]
MVEQHQGHISPDSQWSTYEANVQSYRGLSMSAQSLYLAVGAILLGVGDKLPFFTVLVLAMVTTWYVFFPVIFARCAIVDFHKFDLGSRYNAHGEVRESRDDSRLSERAYANLWRGRALRARVASHIDMPAGQRFRTMRQTRLKLDLFIPVSVTVVWVVFALYILLSH